MLHSVPQTTNSHRPPTATNHAPRQTQGTHEPRHKAHTTDHIPHSHYIGTNRRYYYFLAGMADRCNDTSRDDDDDAAATEEGEAADQEQDEIALVKSERTITDSDGQVGVTHVNEVAPGRQNRRVRRARRAMTESIRRMRLLALTGDDHGPTRGENNRENNNHENNNRENNNRDNDNHDTNMKTIQETDDDCYNDNESSLEPIQSNEPYGWEDPEIRTDCHLIGCMGCLLLLVTVLVVVYLTAF